MEDRRRTPDRRVADRAPVEHGRLLRIAAAAAAGLCGGLALVYLFFAAIGAVDVQEALAATAVAVLMGAVWLAAQLWRHRRADGASEAELVDRVNRERRGF